jgi:hypothetical protein
VEGWPQQRPAGGRASPPRQESGWLGATGRMRCRRVSGRGGDRWFYVLWASSRGRASTAASQLRHLGEVQRDAAGEPVMHADSSLVLPLMCWSCKSWPGPISRAAVWRRHQSAPSAVACDAIIRRGRLSLSSPTIRARVRMRILTSAVELQP